MATKSTTTEPKFRKPRPTTKKPAGFKLTFLGVQLLEALANRRRGTPLAEKKGPIVDRLILAEAHGLRSQSPEIEAILSKAGL